jgi:YidC/Oxa1 family membrane protein insertase
VITDVLTAEIDANGGDLREFVLTSYRQNEDASQPFRLFEEKTGRDYFAQAGLSAAPCPPTRPYSNWRRANIVSRTARMS